MVGFSGEALPVTGGLFFLECVPDARFAFPPMIIIMCSCPELGTIKIYLPSCSKYRAMKKHITPVLFCLMSLGLTDDALLGQTCPPLNPANDGTGIAIDLLISEINPGDFIELYNATGANITLAAVQHQFCSPFNYFALSSLAPGTVVPAGGYATVPWPGNFNDTDAGGEVILFKNNNFSNDASIVDFVCWGTNPHGSRKLQAENVGKWSGGCAAAITGGSIHRLIGTAGTTSASYNVTAAPSPLNCAPDPCAGMDCNDNNLCTTDTCVSGNCQNNPLFCDDGDACTDDDCNPLTGCTVSPTDCDDSDVCTTDACDSNNGCVNTQIDCDDSNLCTVDGCDNITGCTTDPLTCFDSNVCTTDDCDPLTGCVFTPVVCDDGNACTDDDCDPLMGCFTMPTVCDDGNPCTGDFCIQGCIYIPVDCDDFDPCTRDTCINGSCINPALCDDGNICTNDSCSNGQCFFDTIPACVDPCLTLNCNDNDACTSDTCTNGACVNIPITCDDGDACTVDICNFATGLCEFTPNIICDDGDACTVDVCNFATGLCEFTPNIICDDGDACTVDICNFATGMCEFTGINCDDGDTCTIDGCNAVTGCFYLFDTLLCGTHPCDTMICNDNDACTTDTCVNGTCTYNAIDCNDSDPCTNDACVGGFCQYTPAVCDDSDICTRDTCGIAGCVFTPIIPCTDPCDTLNCNDNDPCTDDDCINGSCVSQPLVCDDNNACTFDACVDGTCQYTAIACDDNEACTLDSCENGICSHTPVTVTISGIFGPACIEDDTRPVYSISSFPAGYQYQWSVSSHGEIPDTAQGYSETLIHWTDTGSALVSVVVSIGACSGSASLEVQVVSDVACCPNPCPTSVNDMQGDVQALIMPNPNAGQFFVIVESPQAAGPENAAFAISDITGQSVFRAENIFNQHSAHFSFNLNGYAKGVYLLSINTGNTVIKRKIVVY